MADRTGIEWSDATWNPITGCSRVSTGCGGPDGGGCYAERIAATRLRHHPSRKGLTDRNGRWTGEVRFNANWLEQPLGWRKPRRVFVCAHSDLFHPEVRDEWIDRVFGVMALCPHHVFQVLTKRPERMKRYVLDACCDESGARLQRIADLTFGLPGVDLNALDEALVNWPLSNVWLGVSAENQDTLNERIVPLLETPAAVRWLSAEPLLEEVFVFDLDGPIDVPDGMDSPLHWVVCGGESGPRARPMSAMWARSLRDQCERVGVPFFFKQWGEWREALDVAGCWSNTTGFSREGRQTTPFRGRLSNGGEPLFGGRSFHSRADERGDTYVRLGKKRAGRVLDGRTWDEMPPLPARSGGRG